MPTYTFICRDCETYFEEKRPFAHASDAAHCPICASNNTRKQFNSVALQTGRESIPIPMNNGGGCCGGGSCGCHH